MRTTLRTPFAHDDGTHTHHTHKEKKLYKTRPTSILVWPRTASVLWK